MLGKKRLYLAIVNRLYFWIMDTMRNPGRSIHCQIVREIRSIQESLKDASQSNGSKVHELRKSIKRIRSLLRLLKSACKDHSFREMDNFLKITGQSLTELRESVVNEKTFAQLMLKKKEILSPATQQRIEEGLRNAVIALYDRNQAEASNLVAHAGLQLSLIEKRLLSVQTKLIGYERFIDAVYSAYTKAYNTYHAALHSDDIDLIHDWRKQAKYLLLQFKLSPMLASFEYDTLRNQLDELTDLLGKEHDLAVMEEFVLQHFELEKADRKALSKAVNKQRFKIQQQAFHLGEVVFGQPFILKERSLALQR